MPTFGDWELTMLGTSALTYIDSVSNHRYYANPTGDTAGFLARTMDMDDFIGAWSSICDAVEGKKHSRKQINLSFDEWNVWYHSRQQDEEIWKREKWDRALPLLEDVYNFEDALLVGSMLITLLRNSDRVKIACLAQLVNVIAPIMTRNGGDTGPRPSIAPSCMCRNTAEGLRRAIVNSPVYDCRDYEGVPGTRCHGDPGRRRKSDGVLCEPGPLGEVPAVPGSERSFGALEMTEHIVLHHSDVYAVNT